MKKGKEQKQFQLSELESKDLEILELKRELLASQAKELQQNFNAVIDRFCKRVGKKSEDLMTDPTGRIFIEKGLVTFKE